MKKLRIANINIEFEYAAADFFDHRLQKYEFNDFSAPDMVMKSRFLDEIPKPAGEEIGTVFSTTIVRVGDNRLCRYIYDHDTHRIGIAVYYDSSYSDVEICLHKSLSETVLTLIELEYMYTGFAFSDRITELGGVILHGSSISFNTQGIIFSANSGTGKSTHSALWKNFFGEKVVIVNDDKPSIRFYDGIPYFFGTPWSGKSDLNENMQVPLKSIIFIKQADSNSIERLNVRDSIFCLMSQISRPYYDEKIGLKTMGAISELVQKVPVYKLSCNISREAVETVYRRLTEEGIINI